MLVGSAQKNGIAMRERKSGAFFVRWIVSLSPLTVTPEGDVALWFSTSSAPTMSLMNCAPGDCIRGLRTRSMTNLKVCAVTGWFDGGENLKPLRIVKV